MASILFLARSFLCINCAHLVACPEEERDALARAARHLDSKMREIRSSGKVFGTERIAVMAALNITHELLTMP